MNGDTLRYSRNPEDFTQACVWSVGGNGIDNGGLVESTEDAPSPDFGYTIGYGNVIRQGQP